MPSTVSCSYATGVRPPLTVSGTSIARHPPNVQVLSYASSISIDVQLRCNIAQLCLLLLLICTGADGVPPFTPAAELRGHRAHTLLSRSTMFCTDQYCEVISADEEQNAPVQWHLASQQARSSSAPYSFVRLLISALLELRSSSVLEHCFPVSLKPHRTPVLALDADASRGLLASVSAEQLFIYKSHSTC